MFLFPVEAEVRVVVQPSIEREQIREVFDYWKVFHLRSFPGPNPDMKEWKKIAARLKDGYTVDDLKKAIDGIHQSPFHNGENDRGKKYVQLELCMRDASHVEQFLEIAEQPRRPVLSEKTQRSLRAVEGFVNNSKRLEDLS